MLRVDVERLELPGVEVLDGAEVLAHGRVALVVVGREERYERVRAKDLPVVRLLNVELVEARAEDVRVPVGGLHRVEEAVIAEGVQRGDYVVGTCLVGCRALIVRPCATAARPVMRVLEVEDRGRVAGLGRGHLFDVGVADAIGGEPVEQVGLDRVDPGDV